MAFVKILRNEMPSYLSINFFNQRQEPSHSQLNPAYQAKKKLQTKNKKLKREYICEQRRYQFVRIINGVFQIESNR